MNKEKITDFHQKVAERNKRTIPQAAIKRIFTNNMDNKLRVSGNAIEDLTKLLELITNQIAIESIYITGLQGKKTVSHKQIQSAVEKILEIDIYHTLKKKPPEKPEKPN